MGNVWVTQAHGDPQDPEHDTVGGALLGALLDASHRATPSEVPSLVARIAAEAGFSELVIYLADYEQMHLLPLSGVGVPEREPLAVDQTFGGRAYRRIEVLASQLDDGRVRVWQPLVNGSARIGVLEALVPAFDQATEARCRRLAALVSMLTLTKDMYTDSFRIQRRLKTVALPAEVQWELLPPLAFADQRVAISGVLEPSYRIAGDTFDYALNGTLAHLAIIDAMGHGFEAAVMATVAVNVYRYARRHGLDLPETYAAISHAIAERFGEDRFATGQLAQLDTSTGRVRWLNAGHPAPLLIRGKNVVGSPECPPCLPFGLGNDTVEVAALDLEPGDRLLFLSDGVLEARSATGEFFGEGPLPEVLHRAIASGFSGAEILRRLARAVVEHNDGDLDDDATTVLLEWPGRSVQA